MPTFPRMARRIRHVLLSLFLSSGIAMAADTVPLPDTISPEAKAVIAFLQSAGLKQLKGPAPDDLAGWAALHAAQETALEAPNKAVLDKLGATMTEGVIGGVPVLDIRPKGWTDDGRVIGGKRSR